MPGASEHLDNLKSSLDGLVEADPAVLGDSATVELLHRQHARLEAVLARATVAFDAGGEWATTGAQTCAAWVATRCRIPLAAAQRAVRLGRELRHMPLVESAWLAGALGAAQASLLAAARTPKTQEAFDRDEQLLVDKAVELRYDQCRRVVAYWHQLADPDRSRRDAAKRHEQRRAHLSRGLGGTMILDAVFEPLGGAAFAKVLERIECSLFDADWAEAKERLGREPTVLDLARTPAQRRHDALVEMARRAAAMPDRARLPEPLFTVLVGYETFAGRICELEDGTVIEPGTLTAWLDQAWVERVVFDGPDRVKNVGVRRRLFRGATRRSVEIRDRECFHPTCARRIADCEVDHIVPWGVGGLTIDTNGRLACGHHNRQRHKRPDRPDEPPG